MLPYKSCVKGCCLDATKPTLFCNQYILFHHKSVRLLGGQLCASVGRAEPLQTHSISPPPPSPPHSLLREGFTIQSTNWFLSITIAFRTRAKGDYLCLCGALLWTQHRCDGGEGSYLVWNNKENQNCNEMDTERNRCLTISRDLTSVFCFRLWALNTRDTDAPTRNGQTLGFPLRLFHGHVLNKHHVGLLTRFCL